MKYSLAIIGPKDSTLGFKALGIETFDTNNAEATLEYLKAIKGERHEGEERPKYAIVFVTEALLQEIPPDEYKKLSQDALPAIVPVPDSQGSKGFGFKRLTRMIEQAVGSDIFG